MKLQTLLHTPAGWSAALPSHLDSESTLVLAFGASRGVDDAVLEEVRKAFPTAACMGCSGAGEVLGDEIHDDALVLAVARFERTRLRMARVAQSGPEASADAGAAVARALAADDLRAVFLLSEGLDVNGSALVDGITDALPEGVVVTGGLAGDGSAFERTWVWDGDERTGGVAVAIGLYGDAIRVGHGSRGGWDPFGPERRVTKAEANVLFELDDKPALSLYKTYLGERASDLPASALLFPLAIRNPRGREVVRTVLAVDDASESMTFAGDIPEGATAQLMRANFDRLIHSAGDAAELSAHSAVDAGEAPAGSDVLAVAISCVGRRLILRERSEEELERAIEELPDGTRLVGFYSYGELSPLATGRCDLHNQSMTLTTLWEDV